MVKLKFVINPTVKEENDHGKTYDHCKSFVTRLVRRKSITQLQNEAEGGNELKRTLGSFQLLALGIGGIIGKKKNE
jgi:hypothetical protein